ncbi:protein-glutamate methylesterase/protein-glutamine glutaminase [Elioraea rosea]|uniref:protein-glutamate methylesterase/protein-glutamine glutaminase n=1 Tax=Elioraea rosea TaxID=2492390 RepID=UPI001950C0DF|nr:chemotaxis response regulator protein-glutamate methylesterase [Elioraea rosea]
MRVVVCDDSAVIRGLVTRMLEADPAIEVVGRASNGREAVEAVRRTRPDVCVLDIEMPVMDGLAALPELLKVDPALRVVMASTLTTRGADVAMRALRLGAADYVPKPTTTGAIAGEASFRDEIVAKVKGLARQRRHGLGPARPVAAPMAPRPAAPPLRAAAAQAPAILAVGSSTGGPQALFTLFAGLGRGFPLPVIVTQHMPPAFTPILADHLSKVGGPPCAEAKDGETPLPGRAYLAPGDTHLILSPEPGGPKLRLSKTPPENFCRPAVDPMLRSAVAAYGGRVLVVMLTGMGQDGLSGSKAVVAAGGRVIAQDEATSVVWGMPGAVAQAGLASAVLPLGEIAGAVTGITGKGARA